MSEPSAAWQVEDLPALLDTLFAPSSLGMSFLDCDLRFVYVNDAVAALGGVPVAAYLGRTLWEVLPAVAPVVVPFFREVLDTGVPVLDRRFTDGERHWRVSYYPVRRAGGDLLGIGAVAHEDTDQRRAERLLEESEARYRALVDMCPDAIFEVEDERVTFVNRAAVELMGAASPEALLRRSIWELVSANHLDPARTEYAKAMTQREPMPFETQVRRLDGGELWVHARSTIYERAGRPTMQAVVRDVTKLRASERERLRLMAALAMERERFSTVLGQLPVGVVVVDAATNHVVLANDAAERIWGEPIATAAAKGEQVPLPAALGTALRNGLVSGGVEAKVHCADSTTRIIRGRSAAVHDGIGAVVATVATFSDVTHERRAEEALRRAHDELEARVTERTAKLAEANGQLRHEVAERRQAEDQLRTADKLAAIGTFAAGIAHEINNPLAAILATAELALALNAEGAGREALDAALVRIVLEARRGGQIVKGILRFAREEHTEHWPVDINEVVRELCNVPQERSVAPRCALRLRLARRLPRVLMKPTELEQVIVNLVRNAAQAGASSISIQTRSGNGQVRLHVRDDGRGIAKRDIDRIFDPFFTTRQRDGGTGLGLSIVHGIVTRYAGTVGVHSREGRGTTIAIELPVATSEAE